MILKISGISIQDFIRILSYLEDMLMNCHLPSPSPLDLHMENKDGQLTTNVYHKPSYEPYYLPFSSVHPMHMKKNVPFAMMLRAIRYCSTFQLFINERESLRMALLLNKYPNKLIEAQMHRVFEKYGVENTITAEKYELIRLQVMMTPYQEKVAVDYEKKLIYSFYILLKYAYLRDSISCIMGEVFLKFIDQRY